jgi:hypothetical protein
MYYILKITNNQLAYKYDEFFNFAYTQLDLLGSSRYICAYTTFHVRFSKKVHNIKYVNLVIFVLTTSRDNNYITKLAIVE